MGNINIEIPEIEHDLLRHMKIDTNKEINELVVEAIKQFVIKYKSK